MLNGQKNLKINQQLRKKFIYLISPPEIKNQDNIDNTQKIFDHRSEMNSLATNAKWTEELENKSAA